MIITLEGIDATGKSTVLSGHSGEDGSFCHGVVEKIAKKTRRPVHPTREPGTISKTGDSQIGWGKTPLLSLEPHLNQTLFWINMARFQMMAEIDQDQLSETGSAVSDTFNALVVAGFLAKYDDKFSSRPKQVEAVLSNHESWPQAFRAELNQIQEEFQETYDALREEPALAGKFETYDARDCIRHALVGARDSDSLPPTSSGLLFFADHTLHARHLERLESESSVMEPIFISDRGPHSQLAYAKVRGDSPVVEELYRRHEPFIPDAVLYLEADLGVIEERLEKRGNGNKSWDDTQFRRRLASAYDEVLGETESDVVRLDTTGLSPPEMIGRAVDLLT
jgi:thymidylate kinase